MTRQRISRYTTFLAAFALLATALPGAAASHPDQVATTAATGQATSQATSQVSGPTATVDPAVAQVMAGFGASGDWWTIAGQYFPPAMRQRIAQLLFTGQGIALSQYRYNIGAGGVGATKPTGGESELGFQDRAPQTAYVAPGIEDFGHDPGGTLYLRAAAADHVPVIVANANSAPAAFTTNGQSCGGQLKAGTEQAYADFLTDVVVHAHDAWHVTISYVSPINEPDYTRSDCTQEGMQVTPAQRATLVQDLGRDLAARAPYARVIADESSQVATQFNPEVPQWMSVPGTAQYVAALAHHTYDLPSDTALQQARAIGQQYGKPLWATEICCFIYQPGGSPAWGEQYDPTITGGLALAQVIDQDLTQANDAAFDWWVALSAALGCDPAKQADCAGTVNSVGWNDGLIYFDPNFAADHNDALYPTKRLWTLGNFSRFVRPGAQRHEVTGVPANLRVLAFRTGPQWEIVVINTNAANSPAASVRVTLPGTGPLRADGSYQTSASRDLAPAGNAAVQGNAATLTTPAQSITTFLLDQPG